MRNGTCTARECERKATRKGLCGLHYERVRRHGTTELPPKPKKYCSVESCERPYFATAFCKVHYARQYVYGDVRADQPIRELPTRAERSDIEARILAKCERVGDCVQWNGTGLPSGYGTISWNGRSWVVHRVMWTIKVGPIPTDDDWTIDHLCLNKRCVNVRHLEVVTRTENSLRAGGLARAQGRNKQRSAMECRNGHPRTPENTRYDGPKRRRRCLVCKREAWARNKGNFIRGSRDAHG